ncbi:MAG: hypothetical protein ACQEW9_11420 [Bacteroidota bacterium]
MKSYYWIVFSLVAVLVACNHSTKERKLNYEVERMGSVVFPLDSQTSYFNHFQIVNQGGRDLMYMLTAFNNRFVVYDLKSQERVKAFQFDNDPMSPISIGSDPPSGFYFLNPDSIFLYDASRQKIFLGNEKGEKQLIISMREYFPSEREYWGAAFQNAEPIMLNDSILSVTGAVTSGRNPLRKYQTSDFNLNIKTKEVKRTMVFPEAYTSGYYYPTTRLRPTRALDDARNLLYYNYLNSDSIYIVDLTNERRTSFFASHIDKLPTIETNNLDEYRAFENGAKNQLIYNMSQGTFLAVFYNAYHDHIIRLGYPGIKDFNFEDYQNGLYKNERVLSFYDVKNYEFLGNITLNGLGYDFMFFDENSFYVAEISQNKSEDELVFTKFNYPEF